MAAIVSSFAISGIEGYVVQIEADTLFGQPTISIKQTNSTQSNSAKGGRNEGLWFHW